MKKITVIGLGYVGVPLAIAFANKGFDVTGYDCSENVVQRIRKGIFPESVNVAKYNIKNFKATTKPEECLPNADFIIICVPTPIKDDKTVDTSCIEVASKAISKYLRKGQIVINESTSYPGTVEELIKPILEESGLKAGKDFGLASSPERIDPANEVYSLEELPKLVAGINKEYGEIVRDLYSQIVNKVILEDSIKVVESAKLFENIFRQVNIALVNELALALEKMGLNAFDVIRAASSKPIGFLAHNPGPGVGGDCIPTTPFYLYWKAKEHGYEFEFIKLADKINSRMPLHVVDIVEKNASIGNEILIAGVSYKPNTSDTRNSPAGIIINTLKNKGFKVKYFDPFVKEFSGLRTEEDLKEAIKDSDVVVFLVSHSHLKNFENLPELLRDKTVIDACNFFDNKVGGKYVGLGKGCDS